MVFDVIADQDKQDCVKQIVRTTMKDLTAEEQTYLETLFKYDFIQVRTHEALGLSSSQGRQFYASIERWLRWRLGKHKRELEEAEVIREEAIKHVGVRYWKENQCTSRTEDTAINLAEKKRHWHLTEGTDVLEHTPRG